MRALSVQQPHAARIRAGVKTIETRSWPTTHRGDLLICASRTPCVDNLPTGVAIAIVNVIDCRPMLPEDAAAACVAFRPGWYAWILTDIRPTPLTPVIGQQRLFETAWPR